MSLLNNIVGCQILMLNIRFQMSDIRCQMSDIRCQMSNVKCQMSDDIVGCTYLISLCKLNYILC
jgi:hypothetical protein